MGDKAKKAGDAVDDLGKDASKAESKLSRFKKSVEGFNGSVAGLRNAALVGAVALTFLSHLCGGKE